MFITQWMLLPPMRQYVIEKIKKPLMEAIVNLSTLKQKKEILEGAVEIIRLCNLYPEPTMENTRVRNTAKLLNIRDRFFGCFEFEDKSERAFFEAIWKIIIVEYEHDPYYRYRIDFILEYVFEMGWDSELTLELKLNILIVTRDKFFEYEHNKSRDALFRAIWGISITEYKQNYKFIDWTLGEIKKSNWEPRGIRDEQRWKEPIERQKGVYVLK